MVSLNMKTGRDVEVCSVCNTVIRPPSIICEHCGPPVLPPEDIPESINMFQALTRILVALVVFAGVVYFKAGPEVTKGVEKIITRIKSQMPMSAPKETEPVKPDFQLIHSVNVGRANVRAEPTTRSDVVVVVEKGQVLKVLQKNENWSQVQLDGKKGWIASRLLDSRVE